MNKEYIKPSVEALLIETGSLLDTVSVTPGSSEGSGNNHVYGGKGNIIGDGGSFWSSDKD